MATTNPQAQIQAALMPAALPQEIVPVTTRNRQVQYTQYDPQSVAAYNEAMDKVAPRASTAELLANALAGISDTPSYEGAYGTQVSNPLVSGIANALQGFGGMYGARKQQEREYLTDMLNADRERARIQMEMGKKNITEAEENGVMKVNTGAGQSEFLKNTPSVGMVDTLNELLKQNSELYATFDKDRNSREKYAGETGLGNAFSNFFTRNWSADSDERAARKKFDTLKKQSVVELRQQLKGQGQITDQETDLLRVMESAKNPYEFELAGNTLLDLMNAKTKIAAERYGVLSRPTDEKLTRQIDDPVGIL